jgi:hypothetical protein
MLNLATILEDLKAPARQLTENENLYLTQLTEELRQAGSYTVRWRILEREGVSRQNGLVKFEEIILKLAAAQCAALK